MAQKRVNVTIHSQEKLAEGIYSMWLNAPEAAAEAKPGQFIAVYTNERFELDGTARARHFYGLGNIHDRRGRKWLTLYKICSRLQKTGTKILTCSRPT